MKEGQGLFLVLEGIDGSGTTTQAHRLQMFLAERGRSVLVTHEPSAGAVGVFLRSALRGELLDGDENSNDLDWASMALLFSADRMDHLRKEVRPALENGQVVICDRYDLSGLIYQSATSPDGEKNLPWLRELNREAIRPDLTLVLDVPVEVAESRRRLRDESSEIYEHSSLQARLRELYLRATEFIPEDKIEILSGEGRPDDVFQLIWEKLGRRPEFASMLPEG